MVLGDHRWIDRSSKLARHTWCAVQSDQRLLYACPEFDRPTSFLHVYRLPPLDDFKGLAPSTSEAIDDPPGYPTLTAEWVGWLPLTAVTWTAPSPFSDDDVVPEVREYALRKAQGGFISPAGHLYVTLDKNYSSPPEHDYLLAFDLLTGTLVGWGILDDSVGSGDVMEGIWAGGSTLLQTVFNYWGSPGSWASLLEFQTYPPGTAV
jgi:hypothetical protein